MIYQLIPWLCPSLFFWKAQLRNQSCQRICTLFQHSHEYFKEHPGVFYPRTMPHSEDQVEWKDAFLWGRREPQLYNRARAGVKREPDPPSLVDGNWTQGWKLILSSNHSCLHMPWNAVEWPRGPSTQCEVCCIKIHFPKPWECKLPPTVSCTIILYIWSS